MSWCKCPNCAENTAYNAPSGKRCIPCGYGITPALGKLRTPAESRAAARFLRGETPNYERPKS